MKEKTMTLVILLSLFLYGIGEAKGKKVKTPKVLKSQQTCPIMGNPIQKDLYVDCDGKRIYVCCTGGCIEKIKKNPEKYIKLLQKYGEDVESVKSK